MIQSYFPQLSPKQLAQYEQAEALYQDWNSKINLVSRKDAEHLVERHILHSLAIAKYIQFAPHTQVLDVGTGGGFPGIPLAIMFPQVQFHLVDSIGKKIKVVQAVADALGLKNVSAEQRRAETLKRQFDFVVSRAVTRLPNFMTWVRHSIKRKGFNSIPNGILYLKGGEVLDEIMETNRRYKIVEIQNYYKEDFFETKKIIHLFR